MTDPLLRRLAELPAAQPDPDRTAGVRARCHAVLAGQRLSRVARPNGARRMPEAIVAALAGVYLVEVVRQVLRFYGII